MDPKYTRIIVPFATLSLVLFCAIMGLHQSVQVYHESPSSKDSANGTVASTTSRSLPIPTSARNAPTFFEAGKFFLRSKHGIVLLILTLAVIVSVVVSVSVWAAYSRAREEPEASLKNDNDVSLTRTMEEDYLPCTERQVIVETSSSWQAGPGIGFFVVALVAAVVLAILRKTGNMINLFKNCSAAPSNDLPHPFCRSMSELKQEPELWSNNMPIFVEDICNFIIANATNEGILRMAGSTLEIKTFMSGFKSFKDWDHLDPNAAVGALKSYLRSLNPTLLDIVKVRDMGSSISEDGANCPTNEAIFKLVSDDDYQGTWQKLLLTFKSIEEKKATSLMTTKNISIAINPSLFTIQITATDSMEILKQAANAPENTYFQRIIECYIKNSA